MKRLLLTSSGKFVTQTDYDLFGHKPQDLKWLYIPTGGNDVPDRSYLERHQQAMDQNKINYETVDIAGADAKYVDEKLNSFDVVYVEGGNTFYLLKAIRESGFADVLRKQLDRGLIYIGSSAGSYVACPTIEMSTWKDEVGGTRYDQHGLTDFTAMGLVPFLVFAHYEEKYQKLIEQKSQQTEYDVKVLTDDQALRIEGEQVKLISGSVDG